MDEYREIVLPESKIMRMSKHTYYAKVEGDSMFPLIESGDGVLIDTEIAQKRSITVRGEAMTPYYNAGDTIIIEPVNIADIKQGTTCYVVLKESANGFKVLRFVFVNEENITLVPANDNACEINIHRSQIKEIYKVKSTINLNHL